MIRLRTPASGPVNAGHRMSQTLAPVPSKTYVLVVDDEDTFAHSVRRYLAPHDFDCTIAHDGYEALSILETAVFDILMVDIRMPRMDGFELCRRIRERSSAPLIMCSGVATDAERTFALEIGADDCLVKPVEPRELIARLRALMRRSRGALAHGERVELGAPFAASP
jgi:DNA-binding response OmpR family regulator